MFVVTREIGGVFARVQNGPFGHFFYSLVGHSKEPPIDTLCNPFMAVLATCLATLASSSNSAEPREASIQARLASCDPAVVRAAVDQMFRDPATLREPLMLFHAASGERMSGRKEEAAFLYLAARLRTTRQILFEKGDRPQLLTIMMMTVGPMVSPALEADPELARRVVKRVIDWDRSTPDPFRDRAEAKSGDIKTKLAEIDAGLARIPEQIRDDPARVAKAREADAQAERLIKSSHVERCGPGTLDPVDAEAASTRIIEQAENLAKTHPFILSRLAGKVNSVGVSSWRQGLSRLPGRLTVAVSPASGKGFFAEVDAEITVTSERRLGAVKTSLACITELSIGQRDAFWKDVCRDDPNALTPKQFGFDPEVKLSEIAVQKPICGFPGLKLPSDFAVFAAGAYSGRKLSFQIDQSGNDGTQIDVAANSPDKPVVLILGAYEPTIWNISWSERTKILAVLVGGHHRQAVAGLAKGTPLLNSSSDSKEPCGYFYVTPDSLVALSTLSKRVFGRPVDRVFPAIKGSVAVGERIADGTRVVTSSDTTPESFYDKSARIAGPAGLEDAVRRGLLRKATKADAEAWSDAVARNSRQRNIQPEAGQGVPKALTAFMYTTYVVLGPFTYPSALYGGYLAVFLIPKGVPKPKGDPGHSAVYDFNTLTCQGALCSVR